MKHLKSLVIAALGVALVAAGPMALAQNDPRDQNIPSLELEQAPVHDALRLLFRNVGVSYTVAPDVQGSVTVHLKDKPFETCLVAILKQVNATFRVEGGIYNVFVKPAETTGGGSETAPPDVPAASTKRLYRLKIKHMDPQVIYMLLKGDNGFGGQPEISTMSGVGNMGGGQGFGGGGFGGSGMGGGMNGGGFGGGMNGGGFGGGMSGGMGGGFGGGGFGGGSFGGGGGGGRIGG